MSVGPIRKFRHVIQIWSRSDRDNSFLLMPRTTATARKSTGGLAPRVTNMALQLRPSRLSTQFVPQLTPPDTTNDVSK